MGRQQLLRDVIEHAQSTGLADKSLREIAEAVGTSHRMLLYHFRSREGLLAAIVAENEASERVAAEEYAAEHVSPTDALQTTWERLRKPSNADAQRLFFELAAMAMYERPGTEGVADEMVSKWLEVARSAGMNEPLMRVDIAVIRGLLLDLLITGDRRGTDAALRAYVGLRE
jgi:AcrR family transcriptional regulator